MITLPTKYLKLNIKGEAHSKELILSLQTNFKEVSYNPLILEDFVNRRKPYHFYETKRNDTDLITIKKGIKHNKVLNKLLITIKNDHTSLRNYQIFDCIPRPGHADFARIKKYGSVLKTGSDIYSGRMTIGYVIAGAFVKMALPHIVVKSEIVKIYKETNRTKFEGVLKEFCQKCDSPSAVIKTTIKNVSPGLGNHNYYTTDSLISSLLFKIPGIKAVSFGNDFSNLEYCGSEFNDVIINSNGTTATNHCGGITSGLANGNNIIIYSFARPASSIKKDQKTFNLETNKLDQLHIKGNHDTFYQERMLVVIDSMCYIALYDLIEDNKRSKQKWLKSQLMQWVLTRDHKW